MASWLYLYSLHSWVSGREKNYEIGYLFWEYLLPITTAHRESLIPLCTKMTCTTKMMCEVINDSSDTVCDTSGDTQAQKQLGKIVILKVNN